MMMMKAICRKKASIESVIFLTEAECFITAHKARFRCDRLSSYTARISLSIWETCVDQ